MFFPRTRPRLFRAPTAPRARFESLESRKLLTAAVWTGAGADSLFSDPNNWQGGSVPFSGQDVDFPANASQTTVTFNNTATLGNIEFDTGYTLSPVNNGSDSITLTGNITATAGTSAINNPITLAQSTTALVYENAALSLTGSISDGGNDYGITLTGNGPLTLQGAGDTYTGTTEDQGGLINVLTNLDSSVDLYQNGSFTGDASIAKLAGYQSTFSLTSAASTATVTIANTLTFDDNSGDTINFDIDGPTSSSQFIVNAGTISLGNATLNTTAINSYVPQSGDVITLIKNNTSAAIVGTFNNLPQGSTLTIAGTQFTISYTGGASDDDVTLTATATGVTTPTVTGATTTASTHGYTIGATVIGADASPAGAAGLTYTWTTIHLPSGAKNPTFNVNGKNTAKSVIARFYKDGGYILQCTVTNAVGNSVSTDVFVTVSQKATSLKIEPHKAVMAKRQTLQYTGTVLDQFAHPMRTAQSLAWSLAAGHGSISSTGLFTATALPGNITIELEADDLTATVGALVD